MLTSESQPAVTKERFDAVLFDLDGVLTATAKLHAACWKRLFDEFLERRAAERGEPFRPFEVDSDYLLYVDGKPRFDGVRDFLASREIRLPEGDPDAPPGEESICGLGNRKNEFVNEVLASEGVEAYPGSLAWLRWLRNQGLRTAVVSSSHNCQAVLRSAGISDEFDARVDGGVANRLGLPGKPAPDTFLAAARELGVEPERAVVVEDAIAGVEAGRAGGFGLVIGVDRKGDPRALEEAGAHVVVRDLGELL
jgi:alpha,alpha-trehalase